MRILLLALLAGCACAPPDTSIGLPDRPILEPLDAELQLAIPPHIRGIIGRNDLALKQYARKLELRISAHDAALED